MSQYFPSYNNSSNNVKVELDLANYATKDDVKNITHVDVSSFASKTNLAALKTEVDKIDTDKLKTVPDDLAKLSNIVKNEVVKKTDFSADNHVTRTKFSTDSNSLDDKIDKVEKKIPDVSGLATRRNVTTLVNNLNNKIDNLKNNDYAKKTSLINYMLTSTFNTKSTELERKIEVADIIAKSSNTKANTIRSDLNDYAKKTDVANDYVTNVNLTSKLNDLKAQHTDDKTKKNASDILRFENRLKQKQDIFDENQRELSFNSGFFYYLQQSYLVYECKINSFAFNGKKITNWKLTGIFNYSDYYTMNGIEDTKTNLPL